MLGTYSWELFHMESHFLANENIYIWWYSCNLEKNLQPALASLSSVPAIPEYFHSSPNINKKKKKKSNFCRLHLAPDFQSDKSVSWIFPSLLSVFMRDLFVAGLVGFSICLHQERQVYSLGVVCNLQPTYFLPLICLSHLSPPLFEFRRLHPPPLPLLCLLLVQS